VRDGKTIVPTADDVLLVGDEVYFIAEETHLTRALAAFGHEEPEANRVVIVGAGNIGLYLAQEIENKDTGISLKLVESNKDRARQVAALLSRTTVVQGDVLDDAFVAAVVQHGHEAVASCLGIRYAHPWARRESPDNFISRATANILSAMKAADVRRITAISAAGVAESRPAANLVIRFLIATSNVGIAYADLARVEQLLRESGLDWQAVRPTTLSSRRGTGTPRLTGGFPATASISRADVAAFMLAELERPAFTTRTPMITG
jgi:putative NADH-flavin reductase